jgi:hypothetical protein
MNKSERVEGQESLHTAGGPTGYLGSAALQTASVTVGSPFTSNLYPVFHLFAFKSFFLCGATRLLAAYMQTTLGWVCNWGVCTRPRLHTRPSNNTRKLKRRRIIPLV